MRYPSDGSPLVPTGDIPLVVDGSDQPAVDNDALNQLLPASRRDGTGKMFQAVLTTARTCLNFLWSRYGQKLNTQKTPRFAAGADLAAWGRHLKRPQVADEGEGQYRDRLCTPLNTITPDALQEPVNRLVGELTNIKPLFLEPAFDAAYASPLTFGGGAPTWAAFAQPQARRLWAQDDSRPAEKYGAYASPDANGPVFMFIVPDIGDDSAAPHSMDVVGARATDQDFVNGSTPAWALKAPMGATSLYAAALALPSGRVLVTGGQPASASAPVATAAIYDPIADAWTAIPAMNQARARHHMSLLDSGVVAAFGGTAAAAGGTSLASVEIYDPAANAWTTLPGAMTTARHSMLVTRLAGGKLLVAGGVAAGSATTSGELFDPVLGTWAAIGTAMSVARDWTAGATLMKSGRVLLSGGALPFSTCDIYNPVLGTFAFATTMNLARTGHRTALLPSGRVIAIGGWNNPTLYASCEMYDEGANTWTFITPMTTARYQFKLFRLKSGFLVAAGGYGLGSGLVEQFDPNTNTWSTLPAMSSAKGEMIGVVLPGDEPIGFGGDNGGTYLATVERFAPVLTAYGFVPTRPTNLFERIISEVEPRRSAGYPWVLISDPLLGSDI